jgi:hypothetical protein
VYRLPERTAAARWHGGPSPRVAGHLAQRTSGPPSARILASCGP